MKTMLLTLLIYLPISALAGESNHALKTENDKISYSVGYQIGGDFLRQGLDINAKLLLKGVVDALNKNPELLTSLEMKETLIALKRRIVADDRKNLEKLSNKKRTEGTEFLKSNAKKANVVTLPSGLQYKEIKAGTGMSPKATDQVTVNYIGRLINGNEFDSSYKNEKPASFLVNQVIKGWTEALQLMKTGAKWELYIPAELAYGSTSPLAHQTLIFEIELLAIKQV